MTSDQACITFLKGCLAQLGLRWPGYRRVHRLVCKRLNRRMAELGVGDLSDYQSWIMVHPDEWARIDAMCRIPISRFYRDRDVFEALGAKVLPEAALRAARSGSGAVRCWSAGCASGEEPYTLILLWRYDVACDWPGLDLTIIATDADDVAISRARIACYGRGSLKELPRTWLQQGFRQSDGLFCLKPELRDRVDLRLQDIRTAMPDGPFDVILCRNLVFTYFDEAQQRQVLANMVDRLAPGGFLVLGKHEALPPGTNRLTPLSPRLPIFRWSAGHEPEPHIAPG
jgi:chemotaxis protein methyltransferase CheR